MIITGSQAILGSYTEDELPVAAKMSPEVNIAPMNDTIADALSDQSSFDAGEWLDFHLTYGFYIEGVGKRTARRPRSTVPDHRPPTTGPRAGKPWRTNTWKGACQ